MEHKSQSEEDLQRIFAESINGQDEAIRAGDAKMANIFGRKSIRAAEKMLSSDLGRISFAKVMRDPRLNVRAAAATYLLPYNTEEATFILEEAARGSGITALGAIATLARWRGGEKEFWNEIARISKTAKVPKRKT